MTKKVSTTQFDLYRKAFYKVFRVDVMSPTRRVEVVLPRHLFRWCLYMEGLPKNRIATLSKCNHATVIHSINYVVDWIKTNKQEVDDMLAMVKDEINSEIILNEYKEKWQKQE